LSNLEKFSFLRRISARNPFFQVVEEKTEDFFILESNCNTEMPDSISFEDALVNLQLMFPEWDKDTLEALLVSNDYHVERTIETVLTMSGDTNVFSPSQSM